MLLTFYVHPHHYVRSTNFPDYRKSLSRESEKVWTRVQKGELRYTAEKLIESAIGIMWKQDLFRQHSVSESDVRSAVLQPLDLLPRAPIPGAQNLPTDHYIAVLSHDDGEVVMFAHCTMGNISDDTYNYRR